MLRFMAWLPPLFEIVTLNIYARGATYQHLEPSKPAGAAQCIRGKLRGLACDYLS
jgi:hypothetical protein